ncbi:MAG: hypothetical protein RL481_1772 [Pseudomonadota bacterium]
MSILMLSTAFAMSFQAAPITGADIARGLGEAIGRDRAMAAVADCPEIGRSLRGSAGPVTCGCPAIEPDMLGTSVWGNGVYTDDSNICLAAIHDGRVTTSGGRVTVWTAPGQARYDSATRNGITSWDYSDFEASIRFSPPVRRYKGRPAPEAPEAAPIRPEDAPPARRSTAEASSDGSGLPSDIEIDIAEARRVAREEPEGEGAPRVLRAATAVADCPETGRSLRGTLTPLTCGCPAIAREMVGTSVWGTRVYTDDSNICLAAIHDGRVTLSGGTVTVWAAPGRAVYTGKYRNGIRSIAYRDFEGSIQFTPGPFSRRR